MIAEILDNLWPDSKSHVAIVFAEDEERAKEILTKEREIYDILRIWEGTERYLSPDVERYQEFEVYTPLLEQRLLRYFEITFMPR